MREMVKAFRKLGHEVSLLIMGGTEWIEGKTNPGQSSIKTTIRNVMPSKIWETLKDYDLLRFDKKAQIMVEDRIKEFEPDFIFERANYIQLSGLNAAKKYGIPHFYEFNSPFIDQRKDLQGDAFTIGKAEKIEKQQLAETDCSFVVSSTLKNFFVKEYGIAEGKMKVLPNAIDPDKIKRTDALAQRNLREKLNLSEKDTVVGFVGSIFPWHGVDILINAFKRLAGDKENLKLLVVGSGDILSKLKEQANQDGFSEKIIFTGRVQHEEVFPLIELMDITVLPKSHWYGSPVKLFEYGALEKPIIATNNGPVNDIMVNGKDGLLIDENADALQSALKEMIGNLEHGKVMAKSFHQKILSNHTWQKNAERVIEISEKLIFLQKNSKNKILN